MNDDVDQYYITLEALVNEFLKAGICLVKGIHNR